MSISSKQGMSVFCNHRWVQSRKTEVLKCYRCTENFEKQVDMNHKLLEVKHEGNKGVFEAIQHGHDPVGKRPGLQNIGG